MVSPLLRHAAGLLIGLATSVSHQASQADWIRVGADYAHPHRVLAQFSHSNLAGQTKALQGLRVRVAQRFQLVPGLALLEIDAAPAGRLAGVGDAPKQPDLSKRLKDKIAALRATGLFRYVEPDYLLKLQLEPDDSHFAEGLLWGLRNTGQSGGVAQIDIRAVDAWDLTTGSTNVIVAVIDTGIRHSHIDLADQMWRHPGEIPDNGRDDDEDGYIDNVFGINAINGSGNTSDDHDHGTHVAGIIGAAANNDGPHVGVAWNVRLMACKFLDASGSGVTSDAIEAIDFAVAHGARILNNSWGGGPFSQSLFDAIARAAERGVLFVAAAGNEGRDNDRSPASPAGYALENILSVAAVDRQGRLTPFSNFGARSVHLAAPGSDILSAGSGDDAAFLSLSGTSMAAPHVAGAAALVWARFPNATLNEVRQRLLQGASPIPALEERVRRGGLLNIFESLQLEADGVLELEIFTARGTVLPAGQTTPLFVRVTDLTDVTNAVVRLRIQGGPPLILSNDGRNPDASAGDGVYSGMVQVPSGGETATVEASVSAPGKISRRERVQFILEHPPENDHFANRIPIDAPGGIARGSNEAATIEPGEPSVFGAGSHQTVWWSWVSPATGTATLSTQGSDFDTLVAVYSGADLRALRGVGANDDARFGVAYSEMIFPAAAGESYAIVVDGFNGESGGISLSVGLNEPITNDAFAQRTPLSGRNFTVAGSNFGARLEAGEPRHAGIPVHRSVWWSWTSPSSGTVTVSTIGSNFDTVLAIYRGDTISSLRPLTANDDVLTGVIQTSQVQLRASAGAVFQIAVAGYRGDTGNISLSIVESSENDSFTQRLPLNGSFVETRGYNLSSSRETGEPNHGDNAGGRSVWWSWVAPHEGNVTISTVGSNFDTLLGVYTNSTLDDLTAVAGNDDVKQGILQHSQVSFRAHRDTAYQIAVDGFRDAFLDVPDAGFISLLITMDGASRFATPRQLSTGEWQLELKGEPDRLYLIESSHQFEPWQPILTNRLNGKSLLFNQLFTPSSSRFYRARPASLIER